MFCETRCNRCGSKLVDKKINFHNFYHIETDRILYRLNYNFSKNNHLNNPYIIITGKIIFMGD